MTQQPGQAQTWRDLIDQLTPLQIERLTEAENRPVDAPSVVLLETAREFAEMNLNDQLHFGHLPFPTGSTKVYAAGERSDGRGWSREFVGTKRQVSTVSVDIEGTQFADGTIERWIVVHIDENNDAAALGDLDALQLATELAHAAAELARLQ